MVVLAYRDFAIKINPASESEESTLAAHTSAIFMCQAVVCRCREDDIRGIIYTQLQVDELILGLFVIEFARRS